MIAAWRTLGWIVVPPVFWRRVTAASPVVGLRWLVWALALLLPLHVAASLCANMLAYLHPTGPGSETGVALVARFGSAWLYPFATIDLYSATHAEARMIISGFPLFVWCGMGANAVYWLLALSVWETRRQAGVSAAQVHRAGVYSLGWLVGLGLFRTVRNVVLVCMAMVDPAQAGTRGIFRLTNIHQGIIGIPLVAWISIWWLCALKDGWRIERWTAVWITLTIAAIVGALIPAAWEQDIRWWILVTFQRR